MHKSILILISLILVSCLSVTNTSFSTDKILEVEYHQLTKEARKEIDCLADNVYHEAGYETEQGRMAVAFVTLNRLQDPRFPKDICSVVKQKTNYTCQFTWFCEHKVTDRQKHQYELSREAALYVYANYEKLKDITKGALYYHADYVNPKWKLQKTVTIGRHIFYRERGITHEEDKLAVERVRREPTFILLADGRN
ncbi:spore_SleB, spore cortex-lytic enzyme [uncultured Caudovirales phage]|uniref:Spore_SleB, spore cortex-lytic enzyme n=1 Tax=uncultured Caudovirales phage TaxID=2100421 RepID=A0A6J7WUP4_9CAUD|nr:spore_SleB, spore cortex-lytic enzyme [uncultured Caudovirales phage]